MVPDGPWELVSGCRRLGLGGTENPPPCFWRAKHPAESACSHATRIDGCASWMRRRAGACQLEHQQFKMLEWDGMPT